MNRLSRIGLICGSLHDRASPNLNGAVARIRATGRRSQSARLRSPASARGRPAESRKQDRPSAPVAALRFARSATAVPLVPRRVVAATRCHVAGAQAERPVAQSLPNPVGANRQSGLCVELLESTLAQSPCDLLWPRRPESGKSWAGGRWPQSASRVPHTVTEWWWRRHPGPSYRSYWIDFCIRDVRCRDLWVRCHLLWVRSSAHRVTNLAMCSGFVTSPKEQSNSVYFG